MRNPGDAAVGSGPGRRGHTLRSGRRAIEQDGWVERQLQGAAVESHWLIEDDFDALDHRPLLPGKRLVITVDDQTDDAGQHIDRTARSAAVADLGDLAAGGIVEEIDPRIRRVLPAAQLMGAVVIRD